MRETFGQMIAGSSALLLCAACGGAAEQPPPMAPVGITGATPAIAQEAPVYSFDSLDARPVSSVAFAGKPTVLVFITTYDMLSQGQVDYIVQMSKRDADRTNYAMIALQIADERELVEVYKESLGVTFPVAMGDADSMRGGGPLGDVHQLPTTLVLDSAGRVRWRHPGLAKSDEIRAQLKSL